MTVLYFLCSAVENNRCMNSWAQTLPLQIWLYHSWTTFYEGEKLIPPKLSHVSQFCSIMQRTEYMLSLWCCPGGIWANLREQGDFLLILWFALIQDYTKTPPYSNYHILHDHRIHQLINFNTIFIEDIIAFFLPSPLFNQQIKNINHFYLYLTLSWNRITGQMRENATLPHSSWFTHYWSIVIFSFIMFYL